MRLNKTAPGHDAREPNAPDRSTPYRDARFAGLPVAVCAVLPVAVAVVCAVAALCAATGAGLPFAGDPALPARRSAMTAVTAPTAVPAAMPTPVPTAVPVPTADRSWPVGGRPRIVHGWDPPASPYGPGHRGVDLAAAPGTPVLAAASGRVTFAGRVAGHGVLTIAVSGTPLRTTYEPVRALVGTGDEVTAGRPVAVREDAPSHCPSGCLHWGCCAGTSI